jgi:hypothetical protein
MACLKGTESESAAMILQHALSHKNKPFGLHLAGVTAHVFADTFAHYGFVGLSCNWNKVKGESIRLRKSHSPRCSFSGHPERQTGQLLRKIMAVSPDQQSSGNSQKSGRL